MKSPWESDSILKTKVVEAPFGFIRGAEEVGCENLGNLGEHLKRNGNIRFAWTSESRFVRPVYEVAALQDYLVPRLRWEQFRAVLWLCLFLAIGFPFFSALIGDLTPLHKRANAAWLGITVGVIPALFSLMWLLDISRKPELFFQSAALRVRYSLWLEPQSRAWTQSLVIAWLITFIAGLPFVVSFFEYDVAFKTTIPSNLGSDPFEQDFPKSLITLFTAPMLHRDELHLAGNIGALWLIAPMIEALCMRGFMPLVFLLTAFLGAALLSFSNPGVAGIGGSGGIYGLIGFAFVLGWRNRRSLPNRFWLRVVSIAVIGTCGVAGVDYVNYTHNGGFLGGLLLGLLLVKKNQLPLQAYPVLTKAGQACGVLLLGGALYSCLWLLRKAFLESA